MAKSGKRGRKAAPRARRSPAAPSRPGNELLELAMRAINEGVYDWDIRKGTIYYSEGVHRATGMTPRHNRTPGDWRKRIHPDDLPKYDAALIAHFKGKTERFECDYRFRALDKTWRWARQHGIATRDARGRAVRMVGSTGDISELKRIEQALAESQERYALATQAATEGIYEWNLETGLLYLSDRAKAFFAVAGDALTPAAWNKRVHGEDFQGYRNAIVEYFNGRKKTFEHEYRIRNAAGGYSWVVDRAVAVRNAERRVIRFVGALSDITQRKLHEDELRRARDEATEALEQQKASGEVLSVIGSSIADTAPVFDKILESCERLFAGRIVGLNLVGEDGMLHIGAYHGVHREEFDRIFPIPLTRESGSGLSIVERRVVHYPDAQDGEEVPPRTRQGCKAIGIKSAIFAPMLWKGRGMGAIFVGRDYVSTFSEKEIALLRTFADQAAIAVENVRLFNETSEALERQTATAEILRVIGGSMTDTQPVFDAIVKNGGNLFKGSRVALWLISEDLLHARASTSELGVPMPIDRGSAIGACVLDGHVVHLPDLEKAAEEYPRIRQLGLKLGYRSGIYAPLMREGRAIGGISVLRREAGAFDDKAVTLLNTFADQAVIAIENVRLFNETKEALERQTATAEILKVIASSPSDVQPVFDTIVRNAVALCDGLFANVFRLDGEMLQFMASHNVSALSLDIMKSIYPLRPDDSQISGRVILNRAVVRMEDALADASYDKRFAVAGGWRRMLGVPMLRDGQPLGAIVVGWADPGPIPPVQEDLLKTFADQAAIAIENVRLFNETKEALERQTATAEILKVIASSPADVQPVFDAIVQSAARLFGRRAGLRVVEGNVLRRMARSDGRSAGFGGDVVLPIDSDSLVGSVALECRAMQVVDTHAPNAPPYARAHAHELDFRSNATAPLIREGAVIGVISVSSPDPGALSEKEMALLTTFADQAVIAIENVRLFNETKEALERQTATAEILRVISDSPTDVQPVLDAVARRAAQLCESLDARIFFVDGDVARYVSGFGELAGVRDTVSMTRGSVLARAIIDRTVVHVEDLARESEKIEFPDSREVQAIYGHRTTLAVPLLREDKAIGSILLRRREVRPFSDKQIELLQTFADQAVIAIENVRLFNETKEALERQTATAEILKVMAGSPTDVQPVFDVIVESAVRLCGARFGRVYRYDGSVIQMVAGHGLSTNGLAQVQRVFPRPAADDTIVGRVILTRRPFYVRDIEHDGTVPALSRQMIKALGTRSQVTIPMLRAGEPIGAITMGWEEPEAFDDQQVALLQTFADQAVIAIENVRLFNETREALERQTATAEILKVIASSPSDVQPVFDAIAASARRLLGGRSAIVARVVADSLHLAAHTATSEAGDAALKKLFPTPITGQGAMGKAILSAGPVCIDDIETDAAYSTAFREGARARGVRSIVSAPMLRKGEPIGVISVNRAEPGPFTEHQTNLLKTFADQAVIAIENVRLFNETKEALERQTATAEILKVISSSPTDVQPVFDAISRSAARLFEPCNAGIMMREGDLIHLRAVVGPHVVNVEEVMRLFPVPFDPDKNQASRAMTERRIIEVLDTEGHASSAKGVEVARTGGYRSLIVVPLIREGEGIGAVGLTHPEPGYRLTEKQLDLLQTFADQAVIAIENVRLFNETKEALERQTATAEVLNVISSSPTDVQPVFDAIARSGKRLCNARECGVFRFDGELIHLVALAEVKSAWSDALRSAFPSAPNRTSITSRAILTRAVVQVPDILADPDYLLHEAARKTGIRSVLSVPLVREGQVVGAITVDRLEPLPFLDKQVSLLETFADQAVIAIENVRLFNETKEALEQQTATAEILQVISSSPTNTQPVFEAIVQSGLRLFPNAAVAVVLPEGNKMRMAAVATQLPAQAAAWRAGFGDSLSRDRMHGAAILDSRLVDMPDAEAEKDGPFGPGVKNFLAGGNRAITIMPMICDDTAIGAISVIRLTPGPLSEKQLALLRTFAAQAVIAIENVRIFKELEARTGALSRSVGQLTALGEVGQAISSTLDLETVLKTIVSRAVPLAGLDGGSIYEYDERSETFELKAAENMEPELVEAVRRNSIRKGEGGAVGQCGVTLEPVQVPDILEADYQSTRKDLLIHAGYRAILAVPLLREGHLMGALLVNRRTPGPFAPEVVELLKTFATQSAMAIQNARLFREIAEKGKQLEAASRHKSDFLASMSHELRTPLNAILGFNEMILGQVYGEVPKDMQEPLADIQTSGKHLLRLINNVLDLAKIEAGRMELALSDYSVHDTVESVRSTLRPLAAEKGLEFVATLPADIPLAYGDAGRITQCLMNLAGNSLKFTKAGKVEISVEASGDLLVYKVADTGIGIAPDKLETVFAEFKQTDATIASEYGGTGLGLSISRKFVEMHGGRIWVESELGKGSAFIFEVPLRVKTT